MLEILAGAMRFRSLSLTLSLLCLAGINVRAADNYLKADNFNSFENNIPPFIRKNPVCIDNQEAIQKVLVLINQEKQCFDLPKNTFAFKKRTENLKKLTINKLVSITLDRDPNIRSYQNSLLANIYSSRAAWADAFGFSLSMAAIPSRIYSDTYNKDLIDTSNYSFSNSIDTSFSGNLSMSVNLLDLAEIYNARATAETVGSGKAELQEEAINTVQSAISSLINYWYYKNLSEIYLTDISNSLNSLVFSYGLYQIGQSSASDLSSLLASLRASQANYINNLNSFNSAINSLRRYLNDEASDYFIPYQIFIKDIPIRLASLDNIFVNERLALDPENVQNDYNIKRYQYLSKSQMMNYVPTITAVASLSPTHEYSKTYNSSYSVAPMTSTKSSMVEDEVDITAKIELSWTFFDGLSSINQSKNYSETSKFYQEQYIDRLDELIVLSKNYQVNNDLYFRQMSFLHSEAKAAKYNYDKTLIAYNYSFDDTTSLVQSLNSLSNAKQSLISNLFNYYNNYISLQALLQGEMFDFEFE